MNTNLNYKNAPLPFQGQKRNFIKKISESLKSFPADSTYVDLFGGSGLLSRTIKDIYPTARVIYNDYDDFSIRLQNIKNTNELLNSLKEVLKKVPNKQKVPLLEKDRVLKVVQNHQNKYGYVDFITISSSLLFSGKYSKDFKDFEKQTFYNRIRKSDIVYPVNYLNGLEVVKMDYKTLFEQYKHAENVVFIVDPPYLSTDTKSYNKADYWKLKDYLDVLDVLESNRYIYFTSSKSSLIDLCDWMGSKFGVNPFTGASKLTVTNSVNYSHKYEDIMMVK